MRYIFRFFLYALKFVPIYMSDLLSYHCILFRLLSAICFLCYSVLCDNFLRQTRLPIGLSIPFILPISPFSFTISFRFIFSVFSKTFYSFSVSFPRTWRACGSRGDRGVQFWVRCFGRFTPKWVCQQHSQLSASEALPISLRGGAVQRPQIYRSDIPVAW